MAELNELNSAIRELSDLSQVCTDKNQREQILDKRDKLDDQARELSNKILREGTSELNSAISALKDLTQSAKDAKKNIDKISGKIIQFAQVIDKATSGIAKVAKLIT